MNLLATGILDCALFKFCTRALPLRESLKKDLSPDHTDHNTNPDVPNPAIEANGPSETQTLEKIRSSLSFKRAADALRLGAQLHRAFVQFLADAAAVWVIKSTALL